MTDKYKEVKVLNNYVAVVMKPLDSALAIDDEVKSKYSKEGIVVGIGKDCSVDIKLGDMVIVNNLKTASVESDDGIYAGRTINIYHPTSLIINLGASGVKFMS